MKSLIINLLIIVLTLTSFGVTGSNILMIFPAPSYSHTIAAKVLAKNLVERGHSITLLTTDARPMNHPNITQIDLSFSYQLWNDGFDFVAYKENNVGIENMIESFALTMYEVLVKQMGSTDVQSLIKDRNRTKFDLVIVEAMGFLPYHAFAELYDAPLMGFNSFDAPMDFHMSQGNYVNPFVVNEAALFPYLGELSFLERWNVIKIMAKVAWTVVLNPEILNRYKYLIKTFFPMIEATPQELLDRVEFLMINTHPALGFVRPLVPTTVQLGFIHIEPARALPVDLQRFLDGSRNGVIYLSLGSNVKASKLNPKYIKTFLRVFESLDYDVIWKWETNEMENKPENVMLSKWLPVSMQRNLFRSRMFKKDFCFLSRQQRDLLEHPNIKLFITQGGHQSMEEAIHCKVPVIVIPFLGDQYANANRLEKLKVGLQLDLLEMNEENLREKIIEALEPELKRNMQKLHELVYDQPISSLEKAIFWIEHVIRHKGAKHLEFKGKTVPIYQAWCLDFIVIFVVLSIAISFVSWKVLVKLFKSFSSSNKRKTE